MQKGGSCWCFFFRDLLALEASGWLKLEEYALGLLRNYNIAQESSLGGTIEMWSVFYTGAEFGQL
jgi:hypothetical protein